MIGVYWETWSDWKSNLEDVSSKVGIVYLSFANPNGTYKVKYSFDGTGISASKGFDWYVRGITALRNKGIKVMLSVGGGTYPFPEKYDSKDMVTLANDLGCDGVDIDWENGGISKDYLFLDLIRNFRFRIDEAGGRAKKLSAACWSTGCMMPVGGDAYRGMNIKGIVGAGSSLDWINIMSYDCGPPDLINPKACYWTYRVYYTGKLYLGFQPGVQAWGGYTLTMDDVVNDSTYVKNESEGNGVFIWSWQKDHGASPSVMQIVDKCNEIFGGKKEEPKQSEVPCPNCGIKLLLLKK